MSKDAQIRVRTDARLKEEAESILESLGLTPSAAINMLYRQIVHRRAIPFQIALPDEAAESREGVSSPPRRRTPAGDFTYGDFPQLFWDARADAALNLDDPATVARLLTRGAPETVASVLTLEEIADRLPLLPISGETRAFWDRVLRLGPA